MLSIAHFIVWIVMGLLGGSLAGLITTRERKGFGLARNMGLGLAGAIVGGLLFRLLGLLPGLDQISMSLRDVVAGFVGTAPQIEKGSRSALCWRNQDSNRVVPLTREQQLFSTPFDAPSVEVDVPQAPSVGTPSRERRSPRRTRCWFRRWHSRQWQI